jgi:hypothetical protein
VALEKLPVIYPSGTLGTVLLILIVLMLIGYIPF